MHSDATYDIISDDDTYHVSLSMLPYHGTCPPNSTYPGTAKGGVGQLFCHDRHEAPAGPGPALLHP